ncbi:Thioredoxin [Paenisporosarcina quisquiliarum]|nr:Thioredoxin [Paenisporosarcina quisquiliarum]
MMNLETNYFDIYGKEIRLGNNSNYILIFFSNYCVHCIDLLPEIEKISKDFPEYELIIFSTAAVEENLEIVKYFKWTFTIINLSEKEMEKYFSVVKLPFCIVMSNSLILKNAVIYNALDFNHLMK